MISETMDMKSGMRRRVAPWWVTASALVVALSACDGLLDVQDPDRFTTDDVDQALPAVAAGVEGDLYTAIDQFVIYQGLFSDELQHTGTWSGYDDIDHGRVRFANAGSHEAVFQQLLQARWFAGDSEARFERVLGESEAAVSQLTAQVRGAGAMAQLLLGQAYCEAPSGPSEAAVSDSEILQAAVQRFTDAIQTAQASGSDDWVTTAYAGRARANLLLGNYAEAASDAAQVPDGWVKYAQFSTNSTRQDNDVVQLITAGQNRAAGLREKWWADVDTDANALRDPWTGESDQRIAILFDGSIGVDGVTDHYSQWKYQALDSDIPFFDSEEMRLIEAEAALRGGDLTSAMAIMNSLRAAAGLSDLPATSDTDVVWDYLVHERFAETFMEGQRATDLWRLDLVREVFAALNDSERPADRPTKFPMDEDEARDNPNIEAAASARCLPMS